jgi:hypothetical protein
LSAANRKRPASPRDGFAQQHTHARSKATRKDDAAATQLRGERCKKATNLSRVALARKESKANETEPKRNR